MLLTNDPACMTSRISNSSFGRSCPTLAFYYCKLYKWSISHKYTCLPASWHKDLHLMPRTRQFRSRHIWPLAFHAYRRSCPTVSSHKIASWRCSSAPFQGRVHRPCLKPLTQFGLCGTYSASQQLPFLGLPQQGASCPRQSVTYLICFVDFRYRMSSSSRPLVDAVTMHSQMPCCTASAAACMVFVSSRASSLDLQGPVLNLHFVCCFKTRAKPAH